MPAESRPAPPLALTLWRLTWPMLFGVLALMSFQLVDSAFIAQLGVDPLAALAFTIPIQQVIIGAQVGLGIATTAILSRALGAGSLDRARELGSLVILGGALAALLLCLVIWALRSPILGLLGADPALLPLVSDYWAPWLLSAWCGAVLYFGYSVSRANGDTRLPGMLMVVTSLVNIALDPLYIFVFGWGLPGAAWATVTAFGLGLMIVYRSLLQRHWIGLTLRHLHIGRALADLGGITGPAMLSQLMPPFAAMLATALMAGFGSAAVGAWGLGVRLEFFSIVMVLALTMSLPPLVGRFLGAGEVEKIRRLVGLASGFVLLWQLAIGLLWRGLSDPFAALMAEDPAVAGLLGQYLERVPLSYAGLGLCMLMVSVCNAMGQPLRALLISSVRLFLCYLPALWLGAHWAGVEGVFNGALLGNLAAGLCAWHLYRQGFRQLAVENPRPQVDQPRGTV